jgi:hypothetical protein
MDARIEALQKRLEWYDLFVDYIKEVDHNKYNEACNYADSYN